MRKFTLLLALLVMVPTVVEAQGRRQRVPDPDPQHRATDWIPLSQSMTELLNAGWKIISHAHYQTEVFNSCLLYTSPSPRDQRGSRMPSSA